VVEDSEDGFIIEALIITFYNDSMWVKMCSEKKLGVTLLLWL